MYVLYVISHVLISHILEHYLNIFMTTVSRSGSPNNDYYLQGIVSLVGCYECIHDVDRTIMLDAQIYLRVVIISKQSPYIQN